MSHHPSADPTPSVTPNVPANLARRSPAPPRASSTPGDGLDEWDLQLKQQARGGNRNGAGGGSPILSPQHHQHQDGNSPYLPVVPPPPSANQTRDPAMVRQVKEQIAQLVLKLENGSNNGSAPTQRYTEEDLDGIIESFANQSCTRRQHQQPASSQQSQGSAWGTRWAHPPDNPARYTIDRELNWSQARTTPGGVEPASARPNAPVDDKVFSQSAHRYTTRDASKWLSARPARQAFSTKSTSSQPPVRPHPRSWDAEKIAQLAGVVRLKPIGGSARITPSERSAFSTTASFTSNTGSVKSWNTSGTAARKMGMKM